jgi:hypothetical protein
MMTKDTIQLVNRLRDLNYVVQPISGTTRFYPFTADVYQQSIIDKPLLSPCFFILQSRNHPTLGPLAVNHLLVLTLCSNRLLRSPGMPPPNTRVPSHTNSTEWHHTDDPDVLWDSWLQTYPGAQGSGGSILRHLVVERSWVS